MAWNSQAMNASVTYYLHRISQCFWGEPARAELKQEYAEAPVEFDRENGLIDESGRSKSWAQED